MTSRDHPPAPAGYVLCGGASTRMGRDKALMGDPPWAERVAEALEGAGCSEAVLLGSLPGLEILDRQTLADERPGEGPLAAIAGIPSDAMAVVAACDLPNLTASDVSPLMEAVRAGADCAAYLCDGIPQWSILALSSVGVRRASDAAGSGIRSLRCAFGELAEFLIPAAPHRIADVDGPVE